MSDRALPPGISPGSIPIVRSAVTAGGNVDAYTVPAGRRFRLTHVSVFSLDGAAAAVINPNTDAAQGIVGDVGNLRIVGINGSLSAMDIPCVAGTEIAVSMLSGTHGGCVIVGYEYTPLPGQEV